MFSLICVWINDWVNNREAGDLRRYRAHYDVIVMQTQNIGTGNYQQPQLPTANMVNADLGTETYSPSMQIWRIWDLYTTE